MELLKELLLKVLQNGELHIDFNISEDKIASAVNDLCLSTLNSIKKSFKIMNLTILKQ